MELTPTVIDITALASQQSHEEPATPRQLRQLYASLPLPNARCIRVVDVSCTPSGDGCLSGTLRVVDLDTSPAFTALSYAWGQSVADSKNTVYCNGVRLPITPNCRQALLALLNMRKSSQKNILNKMRSNLKSPAGMALTIWVDAICINQNDDSEKAVQIPLMLEIYTWAQITYVWLGPGTQASDRAIEWFYYISSFVMYAPGIPWFDPKGGNTVYADKARAVWACMYPNALRSLNYTFVAVKLTGWTDLKHSFWGFHMHYKKHLPPDDIAALLDCQWLHRAWTYQEIILASNPVIVRGNSSIGMSALFDGIRLLSGPLYFKDLEIVLAPKNSVIEEVQELRSLHIWREVFATWLNVNRFASWNKIPRRSLPPSKTSQNGRGVSVLHYYHRVVNIRLMCLVAESSRLCSLLALAAASIATFALLFRSGPDESTAKVVSMFISFIMIGLSIRFIMLSMSLVVVHIRAQKRSIPTANDVDGAQTLPTNSILQALRERQVTEPKDRVYATHGVLRSLGVEPPVANYAHSLSRIYHDFFVYLIKWRPAMIGLLVDVGDTQLADVPSWVPDWSTLQDRSWLASEKLYGLTDKITNSASLPEITIAGCEMTVRGVLIGTIHFSSGPIEACTCDSPGHGYSDTEESSLVACRLPMAMSTLSDWVASFITDAPVGVGGYDSVPRAVLAALSANTDPDSDEMDGFNIWYQIMRTSRVAIGGRRIGSSSSTRVRGIMDALGTSPKALDFATRCVRRLAGRRGVFLTRNVYIGSGAHGAAEGDQIALLNGLCAPMILRRMDGVAGTGSCKYKVIGPAFVTGFEDLDNVMKHKYPDDSSLWRSVTLI